MSLEFGEITNPKCSLSCVLPVVIVSYSARSDLPFTFPNMGATHGLPRPKTTPHTQASPLRVYCPCVITSNIPNLSEGRICNLSLSHPLHRQPEERPDQVINEAGLQQKSMSRGFHEFSADPIGAQVRYSTFHGQPSILSLFVEQEPWFTLGT